MTMESRALVYAVLAIAMGYFLVSAVPQRLASPMYAERVEFQPARPGGEEMLGSPEAPAVEGAEPDERGDSAKTASDAASAAAEEASAASSGLTSFPFVNVFGTWILNLFIALGVYFVARRRLA